MPVCHSPSHVSARSTDPDSLRVKSHSLSLTSSSASERGLSRQSHDASSRSASPPPHAPCSSRLPIPGGHPTESEWSNGSSADESVPVASPYPSEDDVAAVELATLVASANNNDTGRPRTPPPAPRQSELPPMGTARTRAKRRSRCHMRPVKMVPHLLSSPHCHRPTPRAFSASAGASKPPGNPATRASQLDCVNGPQMPSDGDRAQQAPRGLESVRAVIGSAAPNARVSAPAHAKCGDHSSTPDEDAASTRKPVTGAACQHLNPCYASAVLVQPLASSVPPWLTVARAEPHHDPTQLVAHIASQLSPVASNSRPAPAPLQVPSAATPTLSNPSTRGAPPAYPAPIAGPKAWYALGARAAPSTYTSQALVLHAISARKRMYDRAKHGLSGMYGEDAVDSPRSSTSDGSGGGELSGLSSTRDSPLSFLLASPSGTASGGALLRGEAKIAADGMSILQTLSQVDVMALCDSKYDDPVALCDSVDFRRAPGSNATLSISRVERVSYDGSLRGAKRLRSTAPHNAMDVRTYPWEDPKESVAQPWRATLRAINKRMKQ